MSPTRPRKRGGRPPGGSRRPASGGRRGRDRSAAGRRSTSASRGLGGEQVEGRQAVRELLLAGRRRVREVLVAEDHDDTTTLQDLVDLAVGEGVPVREISRKRLLDEARTEAPQGVIARAAPLVEHDLDDLTRPARDGRPPFLLALDGVTDPGNLGAVLRTAECAGVTGVVLPRHRAAHISPSAAKAAAGAIEHLPMAVVGGLPAALLQLREKQIWVVGLDAGGDRSLFDIELADEPVCLVLGAEGRGLSRLVRQRSDVLASIPLRGHLGSLNVAAAGALACYEVARRRQR